MATSVRDYLVKVAKRIKGALNGRAFLTMNREEVTAMLREESGQWNTRIRKARLAEELEEALLNEGVSFYPTLRETTTGDTIRFYHSGSLYGNVVRIVIKPNKGDDDDLGIYINKIKGR